MGRSGSFSLPAKKKTNPKNWGPLLSASAYKIAFLSPLHILKSVRTFKIRENLSGPPNKPKEYVAFVLSDPATVDRIAGKRFRSDESPPKKHTC